MCQTVLNDQPWVMVSVKILKKLQGSSDSKPTNSPNPAPKSGGNPSELLEELLSAELLSEKSPNGEELISPANESVS